MCTLDGLIAEHKFRVWVTILGHMSLHFTSLYSLFSIQNLNKSFVFHAVKRSNVAYLQQTFGSDIHILIINRNDMDWTKYDMSE